MNQRFRQYFIVHPLLVIEVNNPLYSVELKIDECVEFPADPTDFRRFKVVI